MVGQQDLDFARTHTHRGDPDTSIHAAESVQAMASRHRAAILREIVVSDRPIAAEPIADKLGLTTLQVMKRISDLKNDDLIYDSGARHQNRSGRWAVKWGTADG
jgi:predicted ArsR family transcriptional regulator